LPLSFLSIIFLQDRGLNADIELFTGLISEADANNHSRSSEVLSFTFKRSFRITTHSVQLAQILVSKPHGVAVANDAQVSGKDNKVILTVATNDESIPAYMRNRLHWVWTS